MLKKFKDQNIVIVGGAGFIGHNLLLKLKELGSKVTIVDSLGVNNLLSVISNSNNLKNPSLSKSILDERFYLLKKNNIQIISQDARDYHGLSKVLSSIKPNVLIHLAAISHAAKSNKDPRSTFDHNLRTLENSLDYSKNNVEHFIYFSSSMVYGNFTQDKVDENSICDPIGIYGALKYAGEKIVKAYGQVFNLNYTIVRPSALYGERCISRRVGQIFIEHSLLNQDIIINGDGSDKLDFTYIEDLVNGVCKIIENSNSYNQIFNLTYGNAKKISEMIDVLKTFFPQIVIKKKEREKLMPERGTLLINKARDLLNYQPLWSLEKGYPKYIKWYIDFFKREKNKII